MPALIAEAGLIQGKQIEGTWTITIPDRNDLDVVLAQNNLAQINLAQINRAACNAHGQGASLPSPGRLNLAQGCGRLQVRLTGPAPAAPCRADPHAAAPTGERRC